MEFIKGMSIGQKLKEKVMHVKNTQRNYGKTPVTRTLKGKRKTVRVTTVLG